MDSFRICLMFGPLAVYLLLLGMINLSRRPLLVSGSRDAAALALAVSGFVVVGPVELFFPDAAAARFGPWVWMLLLAFYGLCTVLVLLLLRPRLIVYNMSVERVRPVLDETARQLDPQCHWAGDSLTVPTIGVQLYMEHATMARNVSLISAGPRQSYLGWRRFESALAVAVDRIEVPGNLLGVCPLCAGLLIVAVLAMTVAYNPLAVVAAMFDMFRL